MGVVYEAEDVRLGRHVALKFIPEQFLNDRKSLERFEREARAASQLNHPNICIIHDIDDNKGHPFIVMEKLEGESLKQRIRGGNAMDLEHLLEVAIQMADAVMNKKPPAPRTINPAVAPELEAIIGRAMEKDRKKRYQTAAEMKADLQLLKRETESGFTAAGVARTAKIRLLTSTFQSSSRK